MSFVINSIVPSACIVLNFLEIADGKTPARGTRAYITEHFPCCSHCLGNPPRMGQSLKQGKSQVQALSAWGQQRVGELAVPRCLGIAAGERMLMGDVPQRASICPPRASLRARWTSSSFSCLQQLPFPQLVTSTEPHPPGARSGDKAAARSWAPAPCTHALPPWIPPLHGFPDGKAPVPPISKLTSPDDHNGGCFSPRRESWSQEERRELWGQHY